MKHSATSSEVPARAWWPLPDPTLTYFPNARFATSDRDLEVGATRFAVRSQPDHGRAPRVADGQPGRGGVAVAGSDFYGHMPVMLNRCAELLAPALTRKSPRGAGATLIDATLGAGGHAERFLTEFPELRVIGLDRDPSALGIAGDRLSRFGDRLAVVRSRYDRIGDVLGEFGLSTTESIEGVLFDLGVSSMQLDRVERGFSYAQDGPLDMRMDPDWALTAAAIVNTYDAATLTDILRRYGEERFASRIAAEIVRRRVHTPFTSTAMLTELLYQVIPAPARRTGGHPAKRTFQALRIAVNGELDSLCAAVPAALNAVGVGGRVVVMAYQSLEDRIVKRLFADATTSSTPVGLPVELPGGAARFVALTRGAERADPVEIRHNPRATAVRLRAVERAAGGLNR